MNTPTVETVIRPVTDRAALVEAGASVTDPAGNVVGLIQTS